MANRPTRGEWKLYVSVPSRRQASVDARRVKKWCDRTKIVVNRGWYEVWMLSPSEGARLILGI